MQWSPSLRLINSLLNLRSGTSLRYLSQNMAQKEPKKKMPSRAANAILRLAKLALVGLHHLRAQLALRWTHDTVLMAWSTVLENLERVGHALSDHGAESRIVEPSFWVVMGLCGVGLLQCLGAWQRPWLFFLVICGCLIITVGSVSIWWGFIGSAVCLPRWQRPPVCWSFCYRCGRMQ